MTPTELAGLVAKEVRSEKAQAQSKKGKKPVAAEDEVPSPEKKAPAAAEEVAAEVAAEVELP